MSQPAETKVEFSIFDTAVIVLVAVVLGSGFWRFFHDDSADIARTAIAALRDDSRAATFRTMETSSFMRALPWAETAHAQQ